MSTVAAAAPATHAALRVRAAAGVPAGRGRRAHASTVETISFAGADASSGCGAVSDNRRVTTSRVPPTRSRSPSFSGCRPSMAASLRCVPERELKSWVYQRPPSHQSRAWRRETLVSFRRISAPSRPITTGVEPSSS